MTQHAKTVMTNHKQIAMIRSHVLARSGVERVRIMRDGNVEAYGALPNTNKVGWYFVGYDADVLREALEQAVT